MESNSLWRRVIAAKFGSYLARRSKDPPGVVLHPNYFLPLFLVLDFAVERVELRFINFLWNDSLDYHHYHLVDWNKVCRPFQEGC